MPIPREYQMPQVALARTLADIDADAVLVVGAKHWVGISRGVKQDCAG